MDNYDKIVNYLEKTKIFNKELIIPGRFSINDIICFYIISCAQKLNNICGNAAEIGVHYGKCSIFLSNLYYEKIFAVDLFEHMQEQNVSSSGNGNLQQFKKLLDTYGVSDKVNIIIKNSLNLIEGEIYNNIMFHIDGGHSYNEVISDLNYAYGTMQKSGVIVVDDAFSFKYPDVSMAISVFLNKNENIVSFLITPTKIYLCDKKYYDFYHSLFSTNILAAFGLSKCIGHASTFMNNRVVILNDGENHMFKNQCSLVKLVNS